MRLFIKVFFIGFGLVFLAVGVGIGIFGSRAAAEAAARAEALQPLTASMLRSRGVGSEVLVEGRIDPRTPTRRFDFVAYEQHEYLGTDSDGDEEWRLVERVTPPLLLDAGGPVTVAADYAISGSHREVREPDYLIYNGISGESTQSYSGLVQGGSVMAIGRLQPGSEGVELQAEFVYAGTRAEYIDGQRSAAAMLPWFGAIFGLVGALVAGFGVFNMLRG